MLAGFTLDDKSVRTRIGIAIYPDNAPNIELLIQKPDLACIR